MRKNMIDVYMGGERDPGKVIIPKRYGFFFRKKYLFMTLIILVIMLLVAELVI